MPSNTIFAIEDGIEGRIVECTSALTATGLFYHSHQRNMRARIIETDQSEFLNELALSSDIFADCTINAKLPATQLQLLNPGHLIWNIIEFLINPFHSSFCFAKWKFRLKEKYSGRIIKQEYYNTWCNFGFFLRSIIVLNGGLKNELEFYTYRCGGGGFSKGNFFPFLDTIAWFTGCLKKCI